MSDRPCGHAVQQCMPTRPCGDGSAIARQLFHAAFSRLSRLSFFVHFISVCAQRKGLCRASPLECRNKEMRPIANENPRKAKHQSVSRPKHIASVVLLSKNRRMALPFSFAIRKRLCYIIKERSGLCGGGRNAVLPAPQTADSAFSECSDRTRRFAAFDAPPVFHGVLLPRERHEIERSPSS